MQALGQPGIDVFREGDEGDRLYLITKGAVRISRVMPGTGEEAITVLKRGACFGEMAVLDEGPLRDSLPEVQESSGVRRPPRGIREELEEEERRKKDGGAG